MRIKSYLLGFLISLLILATCTVSALWFFGMVSSSPESSSQNQSGRSQSYTSKASNQPTEPFSECSTTVRRTLCVPNDPRYAAQYALKSMNFDQAWSLTKGRNIRVGLVDGAVEANHPDLAGKVVARKDFTDSAGTTPSTSYHGTHTAGIISANTDNSQGVAGGCPDCELVVARAFEDFGGYTPDIASAIRWSTDQEVDVINVSFAGPKYPRKLRAAVADAVAQDIVVVAAAGNQGAAKPMYPAADPSVISVGATDKSGQRMEDSNHGNWVDVYAPGEDIISTFPEAGYGVLSGTSQATPHIAALAALLSNLGFSEKEIRSKIEEFTDGKW